METVPQSGSSRMHEDQIRAHVLEFISKPQNRPKKKGQSEVSAQPLKNNGEAKPLTLQTWSSAATTTRIYKNSAQPFRGTLSVPDNRIGFPEQDFTLYRLGNSFLIKNHPVNHWPSVEIELVASDEQAPLQVARFDVRPTGDTTDAEILYTRWVWLLISAGECSLQLDRDNFINFGMSTSPSFNERDFLHRAQLFRKLKFIEGVFNCVFHLPDNISGGEERQIDMVFRGITEGEFILRGDNISFFNYTPTASDEIRRPPFTGVGSFLRNVGDQALILDRLLLVGPISVRLDHAVVANPSRVESLQAGETLPQIRFAVLDNQIHHRFEKYATRRPQLRRQKLEKFKKELSKVEPEELVNLLDRSLQTDVSADEARKIVVGWLQYNMFPDRYCPQEPKLEEDRWRVPIWVTYPRGQGAWVQDSFVDLKTGVVTVPMSVEELRNLGKSVAAECLRAS